MLGLITRRGVGTKVQRLERKYQVYLGDMKKMKGWKKDQQSICDVQPCPPNAPLESDLGSNSNLLLTGCVTLGKSLNLSEPQLPSHL